MNQTCTSGQGARPSEEILLDVRGLAPPEPMELALEAVSGLEQGQFLRMLIGREPHPLYPILQRHGYAWSTHWRDDDVCEVLIRRTG